MEIMSKTVLNAEKRKIVGKKVGALRRAGKLPAVIYGKEIEPTPIVLDLKETSRILATVTSSSVITLNVDGTEYPALVRDKQRDYIKAQFTHVDFLAVSLTETIRTSVILNVIGEAPAVKTYNGILMPGITTIDIECLAEDMPERINVDVSILKEIGDNISVGQLDIDDKITVLTDDDEVIVSIGSQVIEEEPEEGEEEEELGADEPEVIEKGKKEEDEEEE